jgi:prepilin-type N-terminal cleavage/methylation domain-containing protein
MLSKPNRAWRLGSGFTARGARNPGASVAWSREKAFTLIELLVVIGIIAVLASLMLPALARTKSMASEKACGSNLRQVYLALSMYADDQAELYPLELTEHNPHPRLMAILETYQRGFTRVLYCPQSVFSEVYAQNPNYTPKGGTDSVIDTPTNRMLGNISYIYFSFQTNKYCPEASAYWRETANFFPRQLKCSGVIWADDNGTKPVSPLSARWVVSDFFRQGAPFPHGRSHARGVEIIYLDGHVGLMKGRPRENYR